MKVLHIGWGFKFWWGGGYIRYLSSLMENQARKGYDVSYFCNGRYYPPLKEPRLVPSKTGGVGVFEVLNAPTIKECSGNVLLQSVFDGADPFSERSLCEVIESSRPDIVHIHHLMGFPPSLIDIVKDKYGLPVVMTLHDYYMFCPRITLFDYRGANCHETASVGQKCKICLEAQPCVITPYRLTFAFGIRNYILYDALRKIYRLLKKITFGRPESKAARLSAAALRATVPLLNSDPAKTVSAMERRRASNIEKMRKIDLVIAPSKKAAAILKFFAGTRPPVIVIPHALEHISHIRPLVMDEIRGRLNFVVLNAFSGPYKGSELVLSAVEILNGKGLEGKFLLHIYGSMEEGIRPKALKWRNVIYHGLYDTKALDRILDGKHVGIVPSLCDETLCITGLEMLAKGIPVIGNDIGGISDYVTDGVTGWLNKGLSAEGLASIMERIINDPAQVSALNRKTVENAGRFSKKIDSHVSEIGEVYKTVIEKNGSDGQ